jgi:hypothetical protein
VRYSVVAEFDTNPAAAHFVSDGCCGARAEEGVKNEIMPCRRQLEDALE